MTQYLKKVEQIYFNLLNKKDVEIEMECKKTLEEINNIIDEFSKIQSDINKYKTLCEKHYYKYTNNMLPKYSINNSLQSKIELNNGVLINCEIVDTIDDIPNYSLYWVKNIHQFAIKINGIILRGNFINISFDANNVDTQCDCDKIIDGKTCDKYHDNLTLLNNKNIKFDTLINNLQKERTMNFNSWYYSTKYKLSKKNTKFKRIYFKHGLIVEKLKLLKMDNNKELIKSYLNTISYQIIHDILYYQILNKFLL